MEDNFSSTRFPILFAVIVIVGVFMASMVGMGIQEELKGVAKPTFVFLMLFTSTGKLFSFVQFIAFFGPLVGIILGFDAISRERSQRTLSKLVSQPIYRDSIINAKFLAGVATISVVMTAIVLIISGLGIRLIGVVPGQEEILRLAVYLVASILYVSFWLGISILFSVVFRSTATSILASLALWIFIFLFVGLGVTVLADAVAPINQSQSGGIDPVMVEKHEMVQRVGSYFSPMSLYQEATTTILDPMRKTTKSVMIMGPLERLSLSRFQSPLPFPQSFFIVLWHMIAIVAITFVCFGICYFVFMRQEIRTV